MSALPTVHPGRQTVSAACSCCCCVCCVLHCLWAGSGCTLLADWFGVCTACGQSLVCICRVFVCFACLFSVLCASFGFRPASWCFRYHAFRADSAVLARILRGIRAESALLARELRGICALFARILRGICAFLHGFCAESALSARKLRGICALFRGFCAESARFCADSARNLRF